MNINVPYVLGTMDGLMVGVGIPVVIGAIVSLRRAWRARRQRENMDLYFDP